MVPEYVEVCLYCNEPPAYVCIYCGEVWCARCVDEYEEAGAPQGIWSPCHEWEAIL